jgi:hypothetical protein
MIKRLFDLAAAGEELAIVEYRQDENGWQAYVVVRRDHDEVIQSMKFQADSFESIQAIAMGAARGMLGLRNCEG